MALKNQTAQKIISSLLILSILVPTFYFSFPNKKAEAVFGIGDIVIDPAHIAVTVKLVAAEAWKQAKMAFARKIINEITKSTVNWINSGFHGSPLFLENPESFFKDIAKSQLKDFIQLTGYDRLRFPFGRQFALDTIEVYKNQLEINAEYSLSKIIDDPVFLESYRLDFNVGGWDGFLINTQYPQNNYVGYQMWATEELGRRVEGTAINAAEKVRETLQQGQGFLSPQVCPPERNPNYDNTKNAWNRPEFKNNIPLNPPEPRLDRYGWDQGAPEDNPEFIQDYENYLAEYDRKVAVARAEWAKTNECPGGLVTTTPGSIVADQIMTATSSKFRQGELAAAMGNALSVVFDALLRKLMNEGLNTLSNAIDEEEPENDFEEFINSNSEKELSDLEANTPVNNGSGGVPITTEGECAAAGGVWTTRTAAAGTLEFICASPPVEQP